MKILWGLTLLIGTVAIWCLAAGALAAGCVELCRFIGAATIGGLL
jgi:hypothetical protein